MIGSLGQSLVARLVDGRLPAVLVPFVRRRIDADPAWAARYHELRTAQRALEGGGLSAAQLTSLSDAVLGATADATPAARPAGSPWLAIGGVAVCATVALVAVVRPAPHGDELHARGGAVHAGVHVRCLDAKRSTVLAEADVKPNATLACPSAGLLAFSVTNTTSTALRVLGSARTESASAGPIFTLPLAGEPPFVVPAGGVDVAMARGFPLDHAAGERIHLRVDMVEPDSPAENTDPRGLIIEVGP